jgi:hypothetical protein
MKSTTNGYSNQSEARPRRSDVTSPSLNMTKHSSLGSCAKVETGTKGVATYASGHSPSSSPPAK